VTTAPGWYKAQGDPAGTHRYWDGTQWVGDPVRPESAQVLAPAGGFDVVAPPDNTFQQSYGAYDVVPKTSEAHAPVATPADGSPSELTFLPGLKVLAVAISVLKVIPLVLGALLLNWLVDQGRDLDRAIGSGNAEVIRDSANFVYGIFAVMGVLLVVQLAAAFSERSLFLFVIGLVLTVLDVLSFVAQARNGSLLMLVLTLLVAAAQAGMTFWAWTVYRNRA